MLCLQLGLGTVSCVLGHCFPMWFFMIPHSTSFLFLATAVTLAVNLISRIRTMLINKLKYIYIYICYYSWTWYSQIYDPLEVSKQRMSWKVLVLVLVFILFFIYLFWQRMKMQLQINSFDWSRPYYIYIASYAVESNWMNIRNSSDFCKMNC